MKIGIFDSGLGGLAILKEIVKLLPQYDYVYLGDNARVPYGGRSADLILDFTQKAVDFLFQNNCILVVLACNTATATSLRNLQKNYLPNKFPERKILGVIRPTVEEVVENKSEKVGVIGTYATVISESFKKELKKFGNGIKVFQNACPLLVPIIEEGELNWKGVDVLLKKYLKPLLKNKIDTLILGCTHYGLIDKKIQAVLGKQVRVVSEGIITAKKLKSYLEKHKEIKKMLSQKQKRTYFVTDLNPRYTKMAKMFMGKYFRKEDELNLVRI